MKINFKIVSRNFETRLIKLREKKKNKFTYTLK